VEIKLTPRDMHANHQCLIIYQFLVAHHVCHMVTRTFVNPYISCCAFCALSDVVLKKKEVKAYGVRAVSVRTTIKLEALFRPNRPTMELLTVDVVRAREAVDSACGHLARQRRPIAGAARGGG
jgi:hypothetical protein